LLKSTASLTISDGHSHSTQKLVLELLFQLLHGIVTWQGAYSTTAWAFQKRRVRQDGRYQVRAAASWIQHAAPMSSAQPYPRALHRPAHCCPCPQHTDINTV
jgi:hypothetical protein